MGNTYDILNISKVQIGSVELDKVNQEQASMGKVESGSWRGRSVELELHSIKEDKDVGIDFDRDSIIKFLNDNGSNLKKGHFWDIFGLFGGTGSSHGDIQGALDNLFKVKEVQIKPQSSPLNKIFYESLITKNDNEMMKNFATTDFGQTKIEDVEEAKERLDGLAKLIPGTTYEIFLPDSENTNKNYQVKFTLPQSKTKDFEMILHEKSGGNIVLSDSHIIPLDNSEEAQVTLSLAESGILLGHYLQKLGDPADKISLNNLLNKLGWAADETAVPRKGAEENLKIGESLKVALEKNENERLKQENEKLKQLREQLGANPSNQFEQINTSTAAADRLNNLIGLTGGVGGYEIIEKNNTQDGPKIKFKVPANMAVILEETLKGKSGEEIKLASNQIEYVGDTAYITLSFSESRILLGHSNDVPLNRTKNLLIGIQPKF
ncbi:MAG TPA: hypothetical protein VGP47_00940 [Parachlamydiaceae bacterium]|nr:hypothetical protein [Parachlamydiaceae bacterium]